MQQVELELQQTIAQYKWDAVGNAIAGVKFPALMNINGSGSGINGVGVTTMNQFIQLLTVEKIEALTPCKAPVK